MGGPRLPWIPATLPRAASQPDPMFGMVNGFRPPGGLGVPHLNPESLHMAGHDLGGHGMMDTEALSMLRGHDENTNSSNVLDGGMGAQIPPGKRKVGDAAAMDLQPSSSTTGGATRGRPRTKKPKEAEYEEDGSMDGDAESKEKKDCGLLGVPVPLVVIIIIIITAHYNDIIPCYNSVCCRNAQSNKLVENDILQ